MLRLHSKRSDCLVLLAQTILSLKTPFVFSERRLGDIRANRFFTSCGSNHHHSPSSSTTYWLLKQQVSCCLTQLICPWKADVNQSLVHWNTFSVHLYYNLCDALSAWKDLYLFKKRVPASSRRYLPTAPVLNTDVSVQLSPFYKRNCIQLWKV